MAREHHFAARLVWTGAEHGPTRDYQSYSREYRVEVEGKPPLVGSAHPAFLGDAGKHNPEDLLVAALSACHMLSYLALCTQAGIEVVGYEDQASGMMAIKERKMRFVEVTLGRTSPLLRAIWSKRGHCTRRRTTPASSRARSTFRCWPCRP